MKLSSKVLLLATLSAVGCNRQETETTPPTGEGEAHATRSIPADVEPARVGWVHLAPEQYTRVPRWEAQQFGEAMPASTWQPADQSHAPLRWDRASLDESGRGQQGVGRYSVYHGHGCCGACQSVSLLGGVLTQHRIDNRRPVPLEGGGTPHRAAIPLLMDELELRALFATSRQAYIMGGRDVPDISPALAVVGAPFRGDLRPLMREANDPWTPARFCQHTMGRGLQVFRARVREHDVRFMTVALRQGPVIISGAFNRLERGDDGVYRCPADARDLHRHHFMLVVGWELYDRDHDGAADEVVWLVRDDHERRGGDHDTWNDPFPDDEWGRIVPRGCLFHHGRAHSIIPGSVTIGPFDEPLLAGPNGRVSYCEYDPDGDGIPTAQDVCAFYPNPDQLDGDGDGIGDACDPCPDHAPANRPTRGHRDGDKDGVADACDPCPDDPDLDCQPE